MQIFGVYKRTKGNQEASDHGLGPFLKQLPSFHAGHSHQSGPFFIVATGQISLFDKLFVSSIGEFNYRNDSAHKEGQGACLDDNVNNATGLYSDFRRYREALFSRLKGFYALVLYDPTDETLYLSTDQLNSVPLYYVTHGQSIVFTDDLETLLCFEDFISVNVDAVVAYLSDRPIDPSQTFYHSIHRIPRSTTLVVPRGRDIRQLRNIDFDFSKSRDFRLGTDEENIEHFRTLFSEVVRTHVRHHSKRAIAVSMSGGMDSTSIAATLLTECKDIEICIYSAAFTSEFHSNMDERCFIEAFSSRFCIPINYILADDFEPLSSPGTYSEIIFNGPDFDSSFLLHREICIRAKAKQNSALFWGIGGDFLMGSIAHYFDLFASGKLLTLYRYVQHDYEIWWRIVLWHIFGLFKKKPEQTQKALPKWIHRRFERWQGYQHNDISPRSAQFDSPASEYEFYRYINPQFERMMSYMYSLARKQTIEFYNPFLSPSMIETMFALPPHLRYQARIGKYVLRRAMARVLPREIIENGVETTFDQYLSHGLRKNWRVVQPLIRDAELAKMDFIDEREVFRLFQAFEAGDDANREEVWRLISTEMWLRWFKEFNKARTVVRE